MIRLDAATVLLQWGQPEGCALPLGHDPSGERSRLGYGCVLRGTYGLMALGALFLGRRYGEEVIVRDVASAPGWRWPRHSRWWCRSSASAAAVATANERGSRRAAHASPP
jgi:hypothetical protein